MNNEQPKVDLASKSKVALKLLGGGVPNVGFQLGVIRALKDWGFTVPMGCLDDGETRSFGSDQLNPIIGSSSGAFAAIAAVMGYGREELLGKKGIRPITENIIKDPMETDFLSRIQRLLTSRQEYSRLKKIVKSEPSVYEHIINTYYPLWKMDALETYLREVLLDGCEFEDLRAQLLILAVTQEQRLTLILGDENRPRKTNEDYKFQNGLKPWQAASGSMSIPPYFRPYELQDPPEDIAHEDGASVILIDGETRDPFNTDAAEDSGADLVIVSSFYRVHEYTPSLGHISDYGIMPVMWQEGAQGKDARKHDSIVNRERRQKALQMMRDHLEECCNDQREINEKMNQFESVLNIREELDVIEIQAQDYKEEKLSYPYWDPFSLQDDVIDHLHRAGYEVATQQLEKHLGDQHP